MKIVSKSLQDTADVADAVLLKVTADSKRKRDATVIALHGDLGAGKTTFSQAFAKAVGVRDTVSSPTFVIEKVYHIKHTAFQHLIHIDAYRLESYKELLHLGWKDLLSDPSNIILLEWPEKVADILPSDMIKVHFTFIDEKTREIKI